MSGIYIPGMEMPKNCIDCAFGWNGWCHRINNRAFVEVDMRRHDCPLIPVPDHGRLIDGDRLYKQVTKFTGAPHWVAIEIKQAQTIIPADKDGANG